MEMSVAEFIKKYKFEPAGKIHRITKDEIKHKPSNQHHCYEQQSLQFCLNETWQADKGSGLVYLWVKISGKKIAEICYVGQANRSTLLKRCKQHEQGFRGIECHGSVTGVRNRRSILEYLNADPTHAIHVHVRKSKTQTIFSQSVSMCGIEEAAAIKQCLAMDQGLWNK